MCVCVCVYTFCPASPFSFSSCAIRAWKEGIVVRSRSARRRIESRFCCLKRNNLSSAGMAAAGTAPLICIAEWWGTLKSGPLLHKCIHASTHNI